MAVVAALRIIYLFYFKVINESGFVLSVLFYFFFVATVLK